METALDALYTTPPPDFVARREELAAEARKAGRAEDARLIKAARRPTLAAWAANLLLRSRPQECEKLLELGRALREAYRTLDAAELKSLSAQRRVVSALTGQAAELADAAGHRLSAAVRQEVESTLGAVLADQEAADRWATGRLHTALTPPSVFPAESAQPVPDRPPRPPVTERKRRTNTKDEPDEPDEPAERRRSAAAREAASEAVDELAERRRIRRERLARARETAEAAARLLSSARTEEAEADAGLGRARERREAARQRVSEAEQRLTEARAEARRADREQRQAEERHRTAAHALTTAEREAREAERVLSRLDPRGG
ncbi:hypothetical protein SUDANB145_06832 [Streptomyces sp. enrichment culture]|uniref:hypothetical protein n=1 Tax=Streptomyces sp. enrichment culture TaxID=1795815 RepID=UPI003F57735A